MGEGERFTILKHNTPIAVLMPVPSQQRLKSQEVIDNLSEFRKGKTLAGLSLKDLMSKGRK
ncbi:MAG: hypothetical protein RCG15_01165 [Candidatus Rickettsia vulgarisii]